MPVSQFITSFYDLTERKLNLCFFFCSVFLYIHMPFILEIFGIFPPTIPYCDWCLIQALLQWMSYHSKPWNLVIVWFTAICFLLPNSCNFSAYLDQPIFRFFGTLLTLGHFTDSLRTLEIHIDLSYWEGPFQVNVSAFIWKIQVCK